MPDSSTEPTIAFMSHISEERELAESLRAALSRDFPDIRIFLSSTVDSIGPGDNFLLKIHNAINACNVLLVFCSKASIGRPWINIETGAAWAREIDIVPLCHSGMHFADLHQPFSLYQGLDITSPEGCRRLYNFLARRQNTAVPDVDYQELADTLLAAAGGKPGSGSQTTDEATMIWNRMVELFRERSQYRFLFVSEIAHQCGISEEQALAILRRHLEVLIDKNTESRNWIAALEDDAENPRGRQDLIDAGYDLEAVPDDLFVWCRMRERLQWFKDHEAPDFWPCVGSRLAWHGGVSEEWALHVLRQHLDEVRISYRDDWREWICRLR